MHICFITQEYPEKNKAHGGIGTFISTLGPALVEAGHRVSVLGLSEHITDKEESDRGVNIKRLRKSKWSRLRFIDNSRRLNSAIQTLDKSVTIDILETAETGLAFIKKSKQTKYVIRLHGGHHFFAVAERRKINAWKAFQEKRSFLKADGFIGVSSYVISHTGNYLSYHGKKVKVINNPIDSGKFYHSDKNKIIPGRILFVGTVCEKKGVKELILAFKQVREENNSATLILTGRDWKFSNGNSYTDLMKSIISDENIEGIEFTGPVNYDLLPAEYEKAELCVFPSHMETQGIVALEAMSMAKPVIFSTAGPGEETIENNVDGILADPDSPQDIAEKIIYLLKNKELALSIGEKAHLKILDKYNLKKIVNENLKFYLEIMANDTLIN
jgi:glycosyltransferase involved in cell wall biosynthesis